MSSRDITPEQNMLEKAEDNGAFTISRKVGDVEVTVSAPTAEDAVGLIMLYDCRGLE